MHTASPCPIATPKDENELVVPAVNGTMAVMRGCHQAKVQRVVITSSVAAIKNNTKNNFTPSDWADPSQIAAYAKSKTLAEKAAWDFVKKLPANEKIELVTINPGLIVGPNLNHAKFSSGDVIKKLMMGELPGIPDMSMCFVDVRDCAKAHLQAIKVPKAAGKRFILVEQTYKMEELAAILHKQYAKYGYPIP